MKASATAGLLSIGIDLVLRLRMVWMWGKLTAVKSKVELMFELINKRIMKRKYYWASMRKFGEVLD